MFSLETVLAIVTVVFWLGVGWFLLALIFNVAMFIFAVKNPRFMRDDF